MKILAVDTSCETITVAVVDNYQTLSEYSITNELTHSQKMMPTIEHVLSNLEISLGDIDLLACGIGPGSFTGLRIGIATLKGIAQARNMPLLGVNTLDALASNINETGLIIQPMIDAKNNSVYTAKYKYENNHIVRISDYSTIDLLELLSDISTRDCTTICLGNGAVKNYDLLIKNKNIIVASQNTINIKASSIAQLAIKEYNNGNSTSYKDVNPFYLRPSQAERVLNSMKNKVEIREMTNDDIDAVVEIEQRSFSVPWSYESISGELNKTSSCYYVATIDKKVIGYIGMWIVLDECQIANIAVLPECRKNGIGKALLEKAILTAQEKQLTKIILEVRHNNYNAIQLYAKYGFNEIGIRKGYYRKQGLSQAENALIMEKILNNTKEDYNE